MRTTRSLWPAPAVSLVLLLSACGGSDETPDQASGSTPPTASPGPSASASSSAKPSAAATAVPNLGLPTIALASTDSDGRPAAFGAAQAALSGDGNFLAYRTPADDVTPTPAAGTLKTIQVRDLRATTVVAACTTEKGDAANGDCGAPSLSNDGRYIAFESTASNLTSEDKDPNLDVFRKDLRTGEVTLVAGDKRTATSRSGSPSISADGRTVAFVSDQQIYVQDLGSAAVTLVSRTVANQPGDAESSAPKISADGSTVVFRSRATNLVDKVRYDAGDVLVATVRTGKIVDLEKRLRLRLPRFNFILGYSAPTRLGGRIAYSVGIDTLEDDDDGSIEASTTDKSGVFVADLNKATVIHTVRTATGAVDKEAGCEALSADGRHLAYCTFRTTRKGTKESNGYGAYLADLDDDRTHLMSGAPKGTKSPDARPEAISVDGSVVIFRSDNRQRGVEAEIKQYQRQYFVARPAT